MNGWQVAANKEEACRGCQRAGRWYEIFLPLCQSGVNDGGQTYMGLCKEDSWLQTGKDTRTEHCPVKSLGNGLQPLCTLLSSISYRTSSKDPRSSLGLSGPRRKGKMQGRRGVFLPCFGGRTQQLCEVLGRAWACGLLHGQVAKDVWQGPRWG